MLEKNVGVYLRKGHLYLLAYSWYGGASWVCSGTPLVTLPEPVSFGEALEKALATSSNRATGQHTMKETMKAMNILAGVKSNSAFDRGVTGHVCLEVKDGHYVLLLGRPLESGWHAKAAKELPLDTPLTAVAKELLEILNSDAEEEAD